MKPKFTDALFALLIAASIFGVFILLGCCDSWS